MIDISKFAMILLGASFIFWYGKTRAKYVQGELENNQYHTALWAYPIANNSSGLFWFSVWFWNK